MTAPDSPSDPDFASAETLKSPVVPPSGRGTNAVPPEVGAAPPEERFGRYVRILKLGAGAMGEVWKAWDTELNRWVALKFLKSVDPDEIARFEREAQIAGTLSHPNIAAVYEFGQARGRHFLAMQFISGTTLRGLAGSDRRGLVALMRDAARAVAIAHERGIIHRDLKPENLMVSLRLKAATGRHERGPAGRHHVYVTDFGLARQAEGGSQLSATGAVVGTPSYMAPEQARGQPLDGRADVYALGATLYSVLSGKPPFSGENVYDVLRRVQEEEPASLRSIDATIPHELEVIAAKAMMKERGQRYDTANAFADDLDRWLEGDPIAARSASLLYRARKLVAKRRGVAVTAAAGVALAAVLVSVFHVSLTEQRRKNVEQMRISSDSFLEGALLLRRSGQVAGMAKFAERLEEICRKVSTDQPELAEPHYRLGRLYRAQMREDEARAEQEKALALEPGYAPALYERAVMDYAYLRQKLGSALEEAVPGMGLVQIVNEELNRSRQSLVQELMTRDPGVVPRRARVRQDLERLIGRPAGLNPGELLCAQGLLEFAHGGTDLARELLRRAVEKAPELSDAYEALAGLEADARRFEESVRWWTAGVEHDRGYAGHLEGRADVLVAWSTSLRFDKKPWEPTLALADADCVELLRRLPGSPRLLAKRGCVRVAAALASPCTEASLVAVNEGIALAEEAQRAEPGLVDGWRVHALGLSMKTQVLRLLHRPDETLYLAACRSYEKAMALSTHPVPLLLSRASTIRGEAESRQLRGQDASDIFALAMKDLDRVVELQPGLAYVHGARGQLWMRIGNARRERRDKTAEDCYRKALEDYDASVAPEGPSPEQAIGLATLRWNWLQLDITLGRPVAEAAERAAAELEAGLAKTPAFPQAWIFQGRLLGIAAVDRCRRGGDVESSFLRAEAAFERGRTMADAMPVSSDFGTLLLNWGAWLEDRDLPRALKLYRRAIGIFKDYLAVNAENARAWEDFGLAQQQVAAALGMKGAEALELMNNTFDCLSRSLELNPSNPKAWYERAVSRMAQATLLTAKEERRERLLGAIQDVAAAIRLDPAIEGSAKDFRRVAELRLKELDAADY